MLTDSDRYLNVYSDHYIVISTLPHMGEKTMFKVKNAGTRTSLLTHTAMTLFVTAISFQNALADDLAYAEAQVKHKAYVYTELQISTPFNEVPWKDINTSIKQQPGFIDKTWLSGVGNQSAGGFYTFDSIENAQKFVTQYFPAEATAFGVAQTTRVFDSAASENASRDMNSVHYGAHLKVKPGAFVYTEVQLHAVPFDQAAPWRELDPILKQQPGLLSKTWLSGLHTGTPGGLYAFDTIEHAQQFALDYFPTEAKKLNAAFYTRVENYLSNLEGLRVWV